MTRGIPRFQIGLCLWQIEKSYAFGEGLATWGPLTAFSWQTRASLYVFAVAVWSFTVAVRVTAQPFCGAGMFGSDRAGFAHESNALRDKSGWMHLPSRSRTSDTGGGGGGAAGGTAGST